MENEQVFKQRYNYEYKERDYSGCLGNKINIK